MHIRFWPLLAISLSAALLQQPVFAQARKPAADQTSSEIPAAATEPTKPVIDTTKPPPPTIADLVLLLQSYKPDRERVQRLRAEMEAALPATTDPVDLAVAWHRKANAAEELQEIEQRSEFLEKALGYLRQSNNLEGGEIGGYLRVRGEYAVNLWRLKGVAASQDSFLEFESELEKRQNINQGFLIGVYTHITDNYVHLGDLDNARRQLAKLDAHYRRLSSNPRAAMMLPHFSMQVESARGFLLAHAGHLDEAERAYLASIRQGEENIRLNPIRASRRMFAPPVDRLLVINDSNRIFLANTLTTEQRLDESELLLREVRTS